jgi:hypothetical protein
MPTLVRNLRKILKRLSTSSFSKVSKATVFVISLRHSLSVHSCHTGLRLCLMARSIHGLLRIVLAAWLVLPLALSMLAEYWLKHLP